MGGLYGSIDLNSLMTQKLNPNNDNYSGIIESRTLLVVISYTSETNNAVRITFRWVFDIFCHRTEKLYGLYITFI